MIFCRGCGGQIHETAKNCPICGAVQNISQNKSDSNWMLITSFVMGLVVFFMAVSDSNEKWDMETIIFVTILGIIPLTLGAIGLSQEHVSGRWMGITGCFFGAFIILISLGSF